MPDKHLQDLQSFLSSPHTQHTGFTQTHDFHRIIEALLLVANEPLSLNQLNDLLDNPGRNVVHQILLDLKQTWNEEKRGIQIIEVAQGWQIRSHPDMCSWVQKLKQGKPKRLSKAALEALSIIAYRQPVTRSEVELIRGVDSSAVIQKLISYELAEVVGRREDEQGKPEVIGTTDNFLNVFNLRDLLELPTLDSLSPNPKSEDVIASINPLDALGIHFPTQS